MDETDDKFYKLADDHINLSNDQLASTSKGKVSASMMYSLARFNAWVSACGWENSEDMKEAKEETVDYFVAEYKRMLEEHMDDYIDNFEAYMIIKE